LAVAILHFHIIFNDYTCTWELSYTFFGYRAYVFDLNAHFQACCAQDIRASFNLRLPAVNDKSAGVLAQIFCEVAIYFIPNLACVIFSARRSAVIKLLCHLKTQSIGYIIA
jgi:hypothetical protein